MLRLILVRHGETQRNKEGRLQGGFSDTELNDRGREQAQRVAMALKGDKMDAIYSSPLKRALDTAKAIADIQHLEVKIQPDLRELDIGEVDGLLMDELRARYYNFWLEWRQSSGGVKIPGGESLEDLQQRAWKTISRIKQRHRDGTVVAVTHVMLIFTVVCRVIGLDLDHFRRLRHSPAGITILHLGEPSSSLVVLNDTCHLRDE